MFLGAYEMNSVPEIITLQQMLERLQGICGRTFLLGHLKATPFYDGVPTYHRIGNKIVFYPDDVKALMASFEPGQESRFRRYMGGDNTYEVMSQRKKQEKFRKLVEPNRPKSKRLSASS